MENGRLGLWMGGPAPQLVAKGYRRERELAQSHGLLMEETPVQDLAQGKFLAALVPVRV